MKCTFMMQVKVSKKKKAMKDKDAYFEEAPVQTTDDIKFTDMNLSRPILKVSTNIPVNQGHI